VIHDAIKYGQLPSPHPYHNTICCGHNFSHVPKLMLIFLLCLWHSSHHSYHHHHHFTIQASVGIKKVGKFNLLILPHPLTSSIWFHRSWFQLVTWQVLPSCAMSLFFSTLTTMWNGHFMSLGSITTGPHPDGCLKLHSLPCTLSTQHSTVVSNTMTKGMFFFFVIFFFHR
jgi:hypothetical protein